MARWWHSRAVGRHPARSAGHGVPEPGPEADDLALVAGDGRDRSATTSSRGRGHHGWTARHRCDLDVDRRQPQCAVHPAVRVHTKSRPQLLPRRAPWDRRCEVRTGGGGDHRRACRPRGIHRRRSSKLPYGNAGGMALPDGYLPCTAAGARRAAGHRREVQVGYGRTGRWFWGLRAAGGCPISSASPRRWATASHWAR